MVLNFSSSVLFDYFFSLMFMHFNIFFSFVYLIWLSIYFDLFEKCFCTYRIEQAHAHTHTLFRFHRPLMSMFFVCCFHFWLNCCEYFVRVNCLSTLFRFDWLNFQFCSFVCEHASKHFKLSKQKIVQHCCFYWFILL